jgi:hypothetical protein
MWRPSAIAYTQAGIDALMGAAVRPMMLRIDTLSNQLVVLHLRRTWLPFGVTIIGDSLVDVIAPNGSRATVSATERSRVSVAGAVLVGAHHHASVVAAGGATVVVNDAASCVRSDSTVSAHLASERGLIVDTFPED